MMTDYKEDTLVTCPLCDTKFWIMPGSTDQCAHCNVHYSIATELVELRSMQNLISFQKVFADVSGLLLAFKEVTEDTTIAELLVWIKDMLEAEAIDVKDGTLQPRLPGLD